MTPKCRKCGERISLAPPPSWMDPAAMMAGGIIKWSDAFCLADTFPNSIVAPDPKRFMLGFFADVVNPGGVWVAPWPDVDTMAGVNVQGQNWVWFTTFDFGPWVNLEFWASGPMNSRLRVVEVYRSS